MNEVIKYTKDALQNIQQSSLLEQEDFNVIKSLSTELQETFEKKQMFRTETEMRVSVLNDISFPTQASKYWQCVREQSVFFDALVGESFEYRRNELELKRQLRKLEVVEDDLDREEIQIKIDECLYKRKLVQNQAKDRVREIGLWSKIKKEVDDGSFDTSNVNSHQLKSYAQRYLLETAAVIDSNADLSHGEAVNLFGQTQSMLKACEEEGIFFEVIKVLSPNKLDKILPILGYVKQDK